MIEEPEDLKQIKHMAHELIIRLYHAKSRYTLEALKQHCERALEELNKDEEKVKVNFYRMTPDRKD